MRVLVLGALAGAGLAAAALPALAGESTTTRIEPRPFYGAVVTIEEGVRVFRPLPRHDRVIVNPGNRTPVTLEIGDPHVRHYDGDRR
jgi:hypothetical protein